MNLVWQETNMAFKDMEIQCVRYEAFQTEDMRTKDRPRTQPGGKRDSDMGH